jgi:hypothetical protein
MLEEDAIAEKNAISEEQGAVTREITLSTKYVCLKFFEILYPFSKLI